MEGSGAASVLYDATHPLGTLLVDFEHDGDGAWNRLGLMPLHDALHTNRWKQPELERRSGDYLRGRFQSGDPVAVYLAARVWNGYLLAREPRERDAACDRFMAEMSVLLAALHGERPLELDAETGRPRTLDLSTRFYGRIPAADTQLDLWYPAGKRATECVAAYASFYPLITYYLNRLNDQGLCFRRCKVCGCVFLAKSQRYELCSDKCRKAQIPSNWPRSPLDPTATILRQQGKMVLTQRVLHFMDYRQLFPTPTLKILWTGSPAHMASEDGKMCSKRDLVDLGNR